MQYFSLFLRWVCAASFALSQALAEDWPQFLGPHRDGSTTNHVSFSRLDQPSRKAWARKVGHGFSGPVISGDHLVLFHRQADEEVIETWELATGKPLWRSSYPTHYVDDFGFDDGPRGTPAVSDGKIFTFGAEGRLTCSDLSDGKELWHVDCLSRYGTRKGFFGLASSPLVWNGLVMINLGGPGAGVAAFRVSDGQLAWKRTDDEAGYASPVPFRLRGDDVALFFTRAGLVGIRRDSGTVAFTFPWRSRQNASVNAASALVRGKDVLVTASYGTGAVLLRFDADKPSTVWSGDESLSAHYATPILFEDHLYGFHGRTESTPDFRCVDWATGKVAWSLNQFGAGTAARCGDQLVLLLENGELVEIKPSPKSAEIVSRVQVLGTGTRSPFAVGDGYWAGRDPRQLVVLKVSPIVE